MQPFELTLPDGNVISGITSLPDQSSTPTPLLICLHGGSYAADYYDADPQKSIEPLSKFLKVPVISLNRQGYKTTSPLPPLSEGQTSMQEQAKSLDEVIIPAIWEKYGKDSGASSVVVAGNSVGGNIALLVAALHSTTSASQYPLSGLCVSGIGDAWNPYFAKHGAPPLITDETGQFALWPNEAKDAMMLMIPDGRADPAFSPRHALLNNPAPIMEVKDATGKDEGWGSYWKSYAKEIIVPVLSIIGEYDGLWDTSKEAMDKFATFFEKTVVERSIVAEGPHCIELSYQGNAVLAKMMGFAMQCAVGYDLKAKKKGSA